MIQTPISVDVLRAQYPSPRSGSYGQVGDPRPYQPGEYCIGGAFCQCTGWAEEVGLPDLFPSRFDLSEALKRANPRLSRNRALLMAEQIIRANDEEHFEEGWEFLDLALTYGD